MTEPVRPFGTNIWTVEGDRVRMFGVLPFTTRMTVIRLTSGGLWVHSPVKPSREFLSSINKLGPVEHLIAPNKIHSLGIGPWKTHYPAAEVWGSPQFHERHPDITLDGRLTDDTKTPWQNEIAHHAVKGHKVLDEVVFFHQASSTLIMTDLIQKHDPGTETWFWRVIKRMAGILGKNGGVPLDVRLSFRDKEAALGSLRIILDWDFDNLIIAHGFCLQGGAKKDVERRFAWLLDQN